MSPSRPTDPAVADPAAVPDDDGLLPGWDAADVAAADAARLAEGADLMSVASTALAAACTARLREAVGRVSGARVVLLVGAGNNGGDALLAGARLRGRGVGVTALLCGPRHHAPGAAALRRAGGRLLLLADGDGGLGDDVRAALGAADLVVDGLLGIGASGAVRGPGAAVLEALLDQRPASVVACDLPSGLDPDTGLTSGPVLAADLTVTFGAAKTGLLLPWAQPLVGRLQVVALGLGPHLPARPAVRRLHVPEESQPSTAVGTGWPWSWREADKYSRGVLGVAAGEPAYPGAAVLVCTAAAGSGVGMVRLVVPDPGTGTGSDPLGPLVLAAVPEVVVQPLADVGRVQAWVTGPGTSGEHDARAELILTGSDEPAVVDAGALPRLAAALTAGTLRRPGRLLLTPHAGELDRLLTALGEEPAAPGGRWPAARAAAARTGATVLLKGADTLVVEPDGSTVVVPGGPSALATAGAGDVLAGVAGALLAAGLDPAVAGRLGAHVHAVAATRAADGGPLRALAVADAVPGVLSGARRRAWDHG